MRLFVAPDRKVEDCVVVASDFSVEENQRVCGKLLRKRAARSARGPDGEAVHGTLAYLVAGLGGDTPSALRLAMPADYVLAVDELPAQEGTRKSVLVNVLLDTAGRVSHCEAEGSEAGAYAEVACSQLEGVEWQARRSADGMPVPYVDTLRVDFLERQASL